MYFVELDFSVRTAPEENGGIPKWSWLTLFWRRATSTKCELFTSHSNPSSLPYFLYEGKFPDEWGESWIPSSEKTISFWAKSEVFIPHPLSCLWDDWKRLHLDHILWGCSWSLKFWFIRAAGKGQSIIEEKTVL